MSVANPLPAIRSWPRWALLAIGLYTLVIAWLEPVFLLRYRAAALLLLVGLIAALLMWLKFKDGRLARVGAVVTSLGIIAQGAWLVTGWYPAWAIALGLGLGVAFLCFASFAQLSRKRAQVLEAQGGARRRRSFRSLLRTTAEGALVGVAAVVSLVVLIPAIAPAAVVVPLQAANGQTPSFEPGGAEGATIVTDAGHRLTSDVRYGTDYPSSFLDVYIADDDVETERPTYLYVHGGGWIAGSKSDGDPNAPSSGFSLIVNPVLDGGYNFVSIGYGLVPDVEYPAQVKQVSQAVDFLQENAEEYGLDMSDVVVAGGSAGGQIAGQFVNIQTNPAYAEQMGIEPVMQDAPKAVVFDSAVLEIDRMMQTQTPSPMWDYIFGLSARSYVGTSEARYTEASVTEHVTEDFPATFIADGNTATFPDQAQRLHERLDELGVTNTLELPALNDAALAHGYMIAPGEWADRYNEIKLQFLKSVDL